MRALTRLRTALMVGLAFATLTAVLAAPLLVRRALRPARSIAAAAESIRAGDLSRRIGHRGRPGDQLGSLAQILDDCFAELESALERQRRFVADASHEMKTPVPPSVPMPRSSSRGRRHAAQKHKAHRVRTARSSQTAGASDPAGSGAAGETEATGETESAGESGSEPAGEPTPGHDDPDGQNVHHQCPPACDSAAGEQP